MGAKVVNSLDLGTESDIRLLGSVCGSQNLWAKMRRREGMRGSVLSDILVSPWGVTRVSIVSASSPRDTQKDQLNQLNGV